MKTCPPPSPVVASRTCLLLSSLRLAVFTGQEAGLGMLVAGVTHQVSVMLFFSLLLSPFLSFFFPLSSSPQVLKPACPLPFTWTKAQLDQSLATALLRLHNASVTATEQGEEEDESCPLSAPAFVYCFPLLRAAMLHHTGQEDVLAQGLNLISEQLCRLILQDVAHRWRW